MNPVNYCLCFSNAVLATSLRLFLANRHQSANALHNFSCEHNSTMPTTASLRHYFSYRADLPTQNKSGFFEEKRFSLRLRPCMCQPAR